MCIRETPFCPECLDPNEAIRSYEPTLASSASPADSLMPTPARRDVVKMLGGGAAALMAMNALTHRTAVAADAKPVAAKAKPKPAEDLIRELHSTLTADQKKTLVRPWNEGGKNPARMGMYNGPYKKQRIKDHYTKAQTELLDRIVRSISNGDDGYHRISRAGTWDNSKAFENCAAHIFGDPTDDSGNGKFAWLFTGHHLTVRCDGNSEPGTAFGGPLYYGHTKRGYAKSNVFNYQTQSVQSVFDALDGKQRKIAALDGSPGEHAKSIQFRAKGQKQPGIAYADLSGDQQKLVATVMRDVLSPYRKEDGDEVMELIKTNGGMEKIHLAFYRDGLGDPEEPWHFWRLEGPGFVWNYRVLPHVHCYVNIGKQAV